MRIFLTLLAIGACLAHPDDPDNKYGMHYSQHRTSVDTARQGMQERLSKLEAQTLYQRQLGGSENYVAGCTTGCASGTSAYSSRSASSAQRSNLLENSDVVGVGIIGHLNGQESNDMQQRVSSRYSSGSAIEADDLQQRIVPGDLSIVQSSAYRQASRSSHKATEEEENELQKTVGAGYHDLSVSNDRYADSQSHRRNQYQKESESRITSGGRPVYYVPSASGTASYRSSASNSESQYLESRTTRPVPVGQYVSLAVRPGTSTVLTIPVAAQDVNQQRVYSNNRGYQAGSESSRTRVQPGYQINHYPTYSSERTVSGSRSDSEASRTTSYQKPEKLTSTEYSSSRYNDNHEESEEEDTQQRIVPSNIGTSRYSSTSGGATNYQQGYASSRVMPAVPVHTVESASSQKAAEESEQRRYSQQIRPVHTVESASSQKAAEESEQRRYSQQIRPVHTVESASSQKAAEESEQRRYTQQIRPSYTQRTSASDQLNSGTSQYTSVNRPIYSASRTSENEGSQYGSSGTTYYTAPVGSQSRTHSQQSQSQYQAGSGVGYAGYNTYPTYSRTGGSASSLQNRFNSQAMSSNSGDLMDFMSESERLARVQQNQIASSSSSSSILSAAEANRRTVNTASSLDSAAADFVSSSKLANRLSDSDTVENLAGTGGYKRVKSWQKQSKWASGSEYGTDGKPKSYSMLSTAEAEKHNINGAETGYKAATTTLENDGKVSTYSIHTP